MTGHWSSQLRHVVHAQISSSVMTLPISSSATSICPSCAAAAISAPCVFWNMRAGAHGDFLVTAAPFIFIWSRSLTIKSIGDNIFPVPVAGQTFVQRPHSTQAYRSTSCFWLKSSILLTPKTISSSDSSASSIAEKSTGAKRPTLCVRPSQTLSVPAIKCACLPCGM